MKTAIVTGGSSGIGYYTVDELSKKGIKVYELSRRQVQNQNAVHISCDVTDEEQVKSAVEEIIFKEGTIDILINNAGFGISGAVEFTEEKDAKRLFDVDFFGTDNLCRAVIPYMRKNGGGNIINLSSVAAVVPIPFQTYYSAAKSAVLTYSMALANEVKNFGINVCAVLPGDIKTGFTAAREKSAKGDSEYNGRISRSVSKMEKDEQGGMAPETAAKFISKIALKNHLKASYSIGFLYKCAVVLTKIFPVRLLNSIIGKLYAN